MKDLTDIMADVADQDRGGVLELTDPLTGEPTGLKLTVVGPDSRILRRAILEMADELAELMGPDGRVSAENKEKARLNCLAKVVIGWEVVEDGKPVPFSHRAVVRLLTAARWVEAQVDAFTADRANFRRGV